MNNGLGRLGLTDLRAEVSGSAREIGMQGTLRKWVNETGLALAACGAVNIRGRDE